MNCNTSAKVAVFSQTIIFSVQISPLGISDTPFKVVYLQIFSVIRSLSPTRESEKRVFLEMVWTSVVYLLQLHCTHRGLRHKTDVVYNTKMTKKVTKHNASMLKTTSLLASDTE